MCIDLNNYEVPLVPDDDDCDVDGNNTNYTSKWYMT